MAVETVRTLFRGTGHYRQSTPLDGQVFVLHLDFNTRDDNWYLSIHDDEDLAIRGCIGRKLVVNYPVLLRAYTDDRPPGELIVVSSTQGDPGLFDLGRGVILTYIPQSDVEASAAGEAIA